MALLTVVSWSGSQTLKFEHHGKMNTLDMKNDIQIQILLYTNT